MGAFPTGKYYGELQVTGVHNQKNKLQKTNTKRQYFSQSLRPTKLMPKLEDKNTEQQQHMA